MNITIRQLEIFVELALWLVLRLVQGKTASEHFVKLETAPLPLKLTVNIKISTKLMLTVTTPFGRLETGKAVTFPFNCWT